jgi:hypothetical protein
LGFGNEKLVIKQKLDDLLKDAQHFLIYTQKSFLIAQGGKLSVISQRAETFRISQPSQYLLTTE